METLGVKNSCKCASGSNDVKRCVRCLNAEKLQTEQTFQEKRVKTARAEEGGRLGGPC